MKIYMHLKKYIEANRLKQTDVSIKTGINLKTFNAILHGKAPLRADDLKCICEIGLGISLKDFFEHIERDCLFRSGE